MEGMFYGCCNFNSLLSGWNTSNVTIMQEMFDGCHKFNNSINGYLWFNIRVKINWHMIREAVKKRPIIIYWLDVSSRRACAKDGIGRLRDKHEFEEEFSWIM
jgi:surface protein